ncbi:MAG: LytTR family DNA-binding domain-containing protein [Bacteroidota bacterium]
MIHAIAIDDEPPALQLIAHYCDQLDNIQLDKTFTVPTDALKYIHTHPVDLLFLDIQMPEILGTEFRKKIDKDIMVVFISAYSNYAIDGFDLNVIDFLLKPYSLERFRQSIDKVQYQYQLARNGNTEARNFIHLRADYSLIKVPLNSLLYVQGLEDYCKFYFEHEPPMIFRITMKSLMEKLPEGLFARVHRSYIVRLDKAKKSRANTIYIAGVELPIGRLYKEQLLDYFKKEL